MGVSKVPGAGWGLFIVEEANRGELVAEYAGEVVSQVATDGVHPLSCISLSAAPQLRGPSVCACVCMGVVRRKRTEGVPSTMQ